MMFLVPPSLASNIEWETMADGQKSYEKNPDIKPTL